MINIPMVTLKHTFDTKVCSYHGDHTAGVCAGLRGKWEANGKPLTPLKTLAIVVTPNTADQCAIYRHYSMWKPSSKGARTPSFSRPAVCACYLIVPRVLKSVARVHDES